MGNNYEFFIGILAIVSVCLTSLIIFVSCYIEQLRKHPGGLVICQYFSILIYDLHFVLTPLTGMYFLYSSINNEICDCISIVFILAYFLTWNYNTCLAIEVFIKFRKITNTSYSRRLKVYHLTSWIIAIILTVLIGYFKSFGRTSYESCFVKKDTAGHYFEIVPILVNFPLIIIFSILSIKSTSKAFEPLMIGLSVSNLLVALTLAMSNIFTFIDMFQHVEEIEIRVGAAIGACSGIVLSGSRLVSRSLYLKLRKTWRKSAKKLPLNGFSYEEVRDESSEVNFYRSHIWNLSLLFDNLTRKTVAEILITLYIRFKSENLEFYDKKFIINYSKERYLELSASVSYIENCNYQIVYKDNSIIIEYCPNLFHQIRKQSGFTSSMICQSLIDSENFLNIKVEGTNQGGKSGSFFFTSADGKLIIKTIKPSERKMFLKKMLKNYITRIQNTDSKLVRVLGVYKTSPADVSFIIMERILPIEIDCSVYDIKGYVNGNRSSDGSTLKDSNFIEKFQRLDENSKTLAIRSLREDLMFLRDHEVMDYSILIIDINSSLQIDSRYQISGSRPILVGIIDFFQEFNLKKNAEFKLKKLFVNEEISCIPPSDYYFRLLNFLFKYL